MNVLTRLCDHRRCTRLQTIKAYELRCALPKAEARVCGLKASEEVTRSSGGMALRVRLLTKQSLYFAVAKVFV